MEGISQQVPPSGSGYDQDGDFDRVMDESEEELARLSRQHQSRSVKDKLLELDEISLKHPQIDNDPTFNKLKMFLRTFTIKSDEVIQSGTTDSMIDFHFQVRLHDSLRNMLREVTHTEDADRQKVYLNRVYKWFFNKMSSIGAISVGQQKKEDEFMNPAKYEEIEKKRLQEIDQKKLKLLDDGYNAKVQKGWFEHGERTIHKDLIPARERIEFYKRKLPREMSNSYIHENASTKATTNSSSTRAQTAQASGTRLKNLQAGGRIQTAHPGTRADVVYGQSFRPSFNTFYTSGDKVEHESLMRVESKGSYASYIPTDNIVEQKLQKMWRESKNKEVAEKRINDELQKTMKDWGDAKSRYEEDVQRKTENMWFGSNFRARAFVRQTKAKKLDYTRNHLNDSDGSSLLSDSEYEEI
jgi:hypothetical protein